MWLTNIFRSTHCSIDYIARFDCLEDVLSNLTVTYTSKKGEKIFVASQFDQRSAVLFHGDADGPGDDVLGRAVDEESIEEKVLRLDSQEDGVEFAVDVGQRCVDNGQHWSWEVLLCYQQHTLTHGTESYKSHSYTSQSMGKITY